MSVTTKIRMYNQKNLGDCFLLSFKPDEAEESYILIDFGSYYANKEREIEIAKDIAKTVQGKKLIIVLTHQHKDHLSGFASAEAELSGLSKELWLSYLDSEKSVRGQKIRDLTTKYWQKSVKSRKIIEKHFGADAEVRNMLDAKDTLDLFAEDQTGGKAMSSLLRITGNNAKFLTPGDTFLLPGTNDGIRVYVLGPPYDKEMLTKLDPSKDEEVSGLDELSLANLDLSGTLMLNALEGLDGTSYRESNFPFNKRFAGSDDEELQQIKQIKDLYEAAKDRNIDHEWLGEMGRMALHMDNLTNNTSLVLAFEMVASKKVLLFVGDAQIGNWQSWFKVKFKDHPMDVEDLLARTVVYKAGHHSSHNATLKKGLDLMNEEELTILVPVDEKTSIKQGFAMLKPGMLMGYHRKSQGRVFRSDTVEQSGEGFTLKYPFVNRVNMPNMKVNKVGDDPSFSLDLTIEDI